MYTTIATHGRHGVGHKVHNPGTCTKRSPQNRNTSNAENMQKLRSIYTPHAREPALAPQEAPAPPLTPGRQHGSMAAPAEKQRTQSSAERYR